MTLRRHDRAAARHGSRRRPSARKLVAAAVLAGAVTMANAAPADAWTLSYHEGTRIILSSRVFGKKVTQQLHVELRIDGKYSWWLDVTNKTDNSQGVRMHCIIFVGERRIPFQVDSGQHTVKKHQTRTWESPAPTLSGGLSSALIRDHWNDLMWDFQASCNVGAA